jgi:hypothetical protein
VRQHISDAAIAALAMGRPRGFVQSILQQMVPAKK